MGSVNFYAGGTDPVDGTLLTITLQPGAYAETGDYTVSLSYDEEDTVCDAPDGAFGECITLAVEGTVVRGDVNGDGDLSNADAILVLRQIAELVTLDEAQRLAADVNGDGAVNLLDVLAIIADIVGD